MLAAVLVSVSLVYNTGKQAAPSGNQGAETEATPDTPSLDKMSPLSETDHIVGSLDAPVKIVEYSDLECPFCKRFHGVMQEVVSVYGNKVAWIYRHLPIDELHPKARKEAEASECAAELGGNEKFWAYVNRLTEITPGNNGLDPAELPNIAETVGLDRGAFTTCLSSGRMAGKVNKQVEEGNAIMNGRPGTPFSILMTPNGDLFPINGAYPIDAVKAFVDQALALTK